MITDMEQFKKVPFHVEHIKLMDLRQLEIEDVLSIGSVQSALAVAGEREAVTLIHKGRIIACMGFFMILPGVAEVWLIPSVWVPTVPKLFIQEVRRYLEVTAEVVSWHRCQTVTRCDNFHRRWMKAIGFEEEGVLRNYSNGQDFIMSARLFGRST